MQASESVVNQIVYLDYVLDGGGDLLDAELLRPIWDNLRLMAWDASIPVDVRRLASDTEALVLRWLQRGSNLTRDSLERVRASLEVVLRALKGARPGMMPGPAVS